MITDGCLHGGFNVIRRDTSDELMIMNDFESNINLVVNGEVLTQEKIINKYYYDNEYFNKMRENEFVVNKRNQFKKEVEIPDVPKPIEPGQVDPETFFGSSLRGLSI